MRPAAPKGDIAAQKAALSKALQTAYLEHQIASLESQVNAINLEDPNRAPAATEPQEFGDSPRLGPKGAFTLMSRAGPSDARVAPHLLPQHRQQAAAPVEAQRRSTPAHNRNTSQPKFGRIDDDSSPTGSSDSDTGNESWRVAVVDVSALMWAPRCVRKLVQRGVEVVVPLDAVRTLDILKKGNSPVAQAARAATRYVEHASRHWRPISQEPSIAIQSRTDYKRGRGLRLQRDTESAAPPSLGPDAITAADNTPPPKWVASVLGCAAYFTTISRTEQALAGEDWDDEPRPSIMIAHPPLSAEVGPPPVDERSIRPDAPANNTPNYAERAEGYTVSLEAGRFELGIEVLRDDDDEPEVEQHGRQRSRGRGGRNGNRGRGSRGGGGGRGGGRGGGGDRGDQEPEREVKILLRRPVDNTPDAEPTTPVTPTLPVPAAPRSPRRDFGSGPGSPIVIQEVENDRDGTELRERSTSNRGRGKGRSGRGRGHGHHGGSGSGGRAPNPDRGGGFTLLQRPTTLVHHVSRAPGGATEPSSAPVSSAKGQAAPKNGHSHGGGGGSGDWTQPARSGRSPTWNPRRTAYASADAEGPPKVVLLQRPR